MIGKTIQSLDVQTWLQSLGTLAAEAVEADAVREAQLTRMLFQLLVLAPEPCKACVYPTCPQSEVMKLLDEGAVESAIVRMIAGNFGIMISSPIGGGDSIATIFDPGTGNEFTANGSSFTLAAIAATASATFELFKMMDLIPPSSFQN